MRLAARAARAARRRGRRASSPVRRWRTSPASRRRGGAARRAGWDVEARGPVAARRRMRVLAGEEAHVDGLRALRMLGFGPRGDRTRRGRRPGAHARRRARLGARGRDGPVIVCAQAGNVNTGALTRWRDRSPARDARRLGACRRRFRAVGGGGPSCAHFGRARATPTRGRPTRTSGSTSRTTAASRVRPAMRTRAAMAHARRLPRARARPTASDSTGCPIVTPRPGSRLRGAALARADRSRARSSSVAARLRGGWRRLAAAGRRVLNDVC